MLPRLSAIPNIDPIVKDFLVALAKQHFAGDIVSNYADRISLATDNSVYQQLPQAILFPRSITDVVILTQLAQQPSFQSLRFTPRGGGTGTNGQSLNNTIIVDLSRYMNQILALNVEERWVKVQAGVIKDQLNQYLKPYGLFFSPELSTSNRATLGGMINTDASGQGSLQYGKTSDHVLELTSVLINGEILKTQAVKTERFYENLAQLNLSPFAQKLHQDVFECCQSVRETVLTQLPQLNRFITGYDLKNVLNEDETEFNLSRILTGSEGSLAFICEAKLNLLPIPRYRTLINVKYRSFDAALRNAPFMLQAKALSVETIDSKVLNLAKQDIIWHSVSALLQEEAHDPILGINIVEYASNDNTQLQKQVETLCQRLTQQMLNPTSGMIGYQICEDLASIEKIYAMRKKAVGLLGNAKGWAKPIPFVEDTCVPPENLASYISEFRQLLDKYRLEYGMFGHVDAGVLHVRPALDLCDRKQVEIFKILSDQVVALTEKYGGLIWGEHGKGMRSLYGERFFGERLWREIRYIKQLFDPHNRLNPGKISTPLSSQEKLLGIDASMRADFDRHIPIQIREQFKGAMNCNGNGLCFNFDVDSAMCPSMKVSHNRLFSPKGRASLIREWLRLLVMQGISVDELLKDHTPSTLWKSLFTKIATQWGRSKHYDFSHEVKQAMDSCLACKACASQCPIKIDVPTFRAEFNHLYHQRYFRPLKDHVVANVERIAPLMATSPKFFNFLTQTRGSVWLAEKVLGMIDLPTLSSPNLNQNLQRIGYSNLPLKQWEMQITSGEMKNDLCKWVFVVQDPFTSYYDAKVVADFVQLCLKLNFNPILLPFSPNGKAQHIKGFLTRFAKTAQQQANFLNHMAQYGIPFVGVDPAIVLSYRDEYRTVLQQNRGEFHVLTAHEWLFMQLKSGQFTYPQSQVADNVAPWYLFAHCTEATALPNSIKEWQTIFAYFGQQLINENVGCCGMAGTFGHETQHLAMSKDIYALSWQKKLQHRPLARCLATGYSCRSQVKRMAHFQLKHPIQALLEVI